MVRIVSTGATLASPEFRKKKRKERQRKLTIWGLGIAILTGALIFIMRLDAMQISEVGVTGANVITEEEVARNVQETLSGHYLWLIPKTNALLYPGSKVRENLMKEFPRFNLVTLSLQGVNKLGVSVEEREPFALYCPSAENIESVSGCFFLDKNGFVFDEAPAFTGNVYFVYTKSESAENQKGQSLLAMEEFGRLNDFIERIRQLGFDPLAVRIEERDARLMLSGGSSLIWNQRDDYNHLHSNLESFMKSDAIREDADFIQTLKDLDLRTENKIRWTLK